MSLALVSYNNYAISVRHFFELLFITTFRKLDMIGHRVQRRNTATNFALEKQVDLSLDRKKSSFARSV